MGFNLIWDLGFQVVLFKKGRLKVPTSTIADGTILTLLLDSAHLSALSWLSVSQGTHRKCSNPLLN